MRDELPGADAPLSVGDHRVYFHRAVPVIIYNGDVGPAEIIELINHMSRGDDTLGAAVADVTAMGSFGAETRKALARSKSLQDEKSDRVVTIFVNGANLTKRAIMTLATTAARLLSRSRRGFSVRYTSTLDEALRELDALLDARPS